MDVLGLSRAIEARAMEIRDGDGGTMDLADAKDLLRALARVLRGESIRAAFGSPGDWGYDSAIGRALSCADPQSIAADRVAGQLEVGRTETHEIVVSYSDLKPDENGIGHIVFSHRQARDFANLLVKHAAYAEAEARGEQSPYEGIVGGG
jgi:hypothetical protein